MMWDLFSKHIFSLDTRDILKEAILKISFYDLVKIKVLAKFKNLKYLTYIHYIVLQKKKMVGVYSCFKIKTTTSTQGLI